MHAPARPTTAYRTPHAPDAAPPSTDPIVEVRALWNDDTLLHVSHLDDGDRFTLSDGPSPSPHHLTVPDLPARSHPLVTVHGTTARVTPLDAPPFDLDAPASLTVGALRFELRRVPRAPKLPPPRRARFVPAALAVSLLCTASLGALRRDDDPAWLVREDRSTWITAHLRASATRAEVPVHAQTDGATEGGRGTRASHDEGRVGRRDSRAQNRRWRERPSTADARTRGAIAVERTWAGLAMGNLLLAVHAPMRFMPDATEAAAVPQTGNMYGDAIGDAHGDSAFGLLGTGFGGGGSGEGTVGLGRIVTRGHGDQRRDGQGLGRGGWGCGCIDLPSRGIGTVRGVSASLGRATRGAPTVCNATDDTWIRTGHCAPADVPSLLDPASVRRVVRANLGQVRHCYERALELNPSAEGSLSIRWVVGTDGAVLTARAESNDTGVDSLGECVSDAVRRWHFPATGDTVVGVTYPFTLSRETP